jgi:hypothetical protein
MIEQTIRLTVDVTVQAQTHVDASDYLNIVVTPDNRGASPDEELAVTGVNVVPPVQPPEAPDGCPRCHSQNLAYDSIMVQGNGAMQEAACIDCNHHWTEHYVFTHISTEE